MERHRVFYKKITEEGWGMAQEGKCIAGGREPPAAAKRNVTESERWEPWSKTVTVGESDGTAQHSLPRSLSSLWASIE